KRTSINEWQFPFELWLFLLRNLCDFCVRLSAPAPAPASLLLRMLHLPVLRVALHAALLGVDRRGARLRVGGLGRIRRPRRWARRRVVLAWRIRLRLDRVRGRGVRHGFRRGSWATAPARPALPHHAPAPAACARRPAGRSHRPGCPAAAPRAAGWRRSPGVS